MHMRVAPFGCHKRRNVAFGESPVTSTCIAPPDRSDAATSGDRGWMSGREGRKGEREERDPGHRTWPLIGGLVCGTIPEISLRDVCIRLGWKRDTEAHLRQTSDYADGIRNYRVEKPHLRHRRSMSRRVRFTRREGEAIINCSEVYLTPSNKK